MTERTITCGLLKIFMCFAIMMACIYLVNCQVLAAPETGVYSEKAKIYGEKRELFLNDPMFHLEAAKKGLTFEELLNMKVERILSNAKRGVNNKKVNNRPILRAVGNQGNNLFAHVKLIKQPDSYSCGPTSALQVIYGMGQQDRVSGSTDSEKIKTLKKEAEMTTSTVVWKLVRTLNQYTPSYGNYEYILGKNMTVSDFQKKVETSLAYDFGPILHARTEELPYYGGHESGHYIAVSELDKVNNTITLKDCNRNNKYYGTHTESISDVFKCISPKKFERYLICYEY